MKVKPQGLFKRVFKTAVRRTERGETRRRALLDAAREVFLESGYEGASIEAVMRRVGGSKASLYSYFGSKEGLFSEILLAQTDDFMQEIALPEQADEQLEKTLHTIGKQLLRLMLDERRRSLFRIFIAESQRFPELAKTFYELGPQRGCKTLGRYLALQCAAGRLSLKDPELAAGQFFDLVKGQPHQCAMLGLPSFRRGTSIDSHVASAVQLFLYGYAPRTPLTKK